ncbi:MAG: peptidase [Rhodobacter sp.]|nr:peptidase [Rhodobacter sp.]MBS3981100.1 C40 family peptidase [Paracoccaceae bacterium]
MTAAERAIAEARAWIGTPYLHQASTRCAGTDCLGLLRGVWRAIYGGEPEPVPAYTADWAEPQHREVLFEAASRWLVSKPLNEPAVGDVLLFRMREGAIAKHLGLQSEVGPHPKFIHSYTGHGVVESSLSQPWQRRIAARFAFPEGTT